MTERKLRKQSDKVLKKLASDKFIQPIKYTIGDPENTYNLEIDFFKSLSISNFDAVYITEYLVKSGFIRLIVEQRSHSADHILFKDVECLLIQIQLEKAGRLFINSTSFSKEHSRATILKWLPLYISAAALIFTVTYNLWPNGTKLRLACTPCAAITTRSAARAPIIRSRRGSTSRMRS